MHAPTSKNIIMVRLGFFGTAVLVAGLALFPNLSLPEPMILRGFADKVYHVIGCAILVVLAVEGWSLARRLVILALPLAFSLEWIQALIPGRGIHIADSVANVVGVSFAIIFLMSLGRWTKSRRPNHIVCKGGSLHSRD